jgi:hypothetical protein
MNKYFAWIISNQLYGSLEKGGISQTYVIPGEMMRGYERVLVGSGVWLIVRGVQDEVAGFIKPRWIERFKDAYYNGDYLLHANFRSSFRIGSSSGSAGLLHVPGFEYLPLGINEIATESSLRIFSLARSIVQIKFTPPSLIPIQYPDLDNIPKRRESLAKIAINSITQNYSLGNTWAAGPPMKLSPFANFAYALIKDRFGSVTADECLAYLRAYDPLNDVLQSEDGLSTFRMPVSVNERMVDLEFTRIDPRSVYAREFIASDRIVDLEAALAKTGMAEKLHQDMLRDIAEFMLSTGITPYETRSIDLIVRLEGRMNIYEIKSTNEANLFTQSAKGSFQLACYCEAMKNDYDYLRPVLIIRKTHDGDSEEMCVNALRRLGITCLIYDYTQEWPYKVKNLLKI